MKKKQDLKIARSDSSNGRIRGEERERERWCCGKGKREKRKGDWRLGVKEEDQCDLVLKQ